MGMFNQLDGPAPKQFIGTVGAYDGFKGELYCVECLTEERPDWMLVFWIDEDGNVFPAAFPNEGTANKYHKVLLEMFQARGKENPLRVSKFIRG